MGTVCSHDKLFNVWVSMDYTIMKTSLCTKSAAIEAVKSLHFQYLQFSNQIDDEKFGLEHYAKSLALEKNMLGL